MVIGAPIGTAIGAAFGTPVISIPDDRSVEIVVRSLIIPQSKTTEGQLIKANIAVFNEIVTALGDDWSRISGISPRDWEKLLAAAFDMDGYDEVILTPPSADGGKDVIAIKKEGVGALKIFADMKRIKLGGEVPYTDVRALAHVVQMTPDVSKGIMATTADFPPRMLEDETIAPLLSTRLQLIPGSELQPWLNSLKKA